MTSSRSLTTVPVTGAGRRGGGDVGGSEGRRDGAANAPVDWLALSGPGDVSRLRHRARSAAIAAGLGLVDQTRLLTATGELAGNALLHASGAAAAVEVVEGAAGTGVRVVVRDEGPGIADLELALSEGWTTGSGLGVGLPRVRHLVDAFAIETGPGRGTRVEVTVFARPRPRGRGG